MRHARIVQRQEGFLDIRVDPCFMAVMRRLGTCVDHLRKAAVGGDYETVLPDCLCQ
jgi:hypothetical protein